MSMSSVFVVSNALRLQLFKAQSDECDMKKIHKEDKIMETVIKVDGMMCVHCKARVENVCKAVAGVVDAVVDLEAKQVTVSGAGYEVIGD